MITTTTALIIAAGLSAAAGWNARKAHNLELAKRDLTDQLARTDAVLANVRAELATARKHADVANRDLTRAIGGLRWFGIRGNWTGDGGRAGRFAWTGGTDWPWLRARKAMGRFWTPEPGGEVKDE